MAEYPTEMTPALREVLGMMVFECGPIARGFREAGYEIKEKGEAEQAFVLHWLIPIALEHGENWRRAAGEQLQKICDKIKDKQQNA